MRSHPDLEKLTNAAARRLLLLRAIADECTGPVTPESERKLAVVAIEAVNLWALFSRSFYLSCFLSGRRRSGSRVALSLARIGNKRDAIRFSIQELKPKLKNKSSWRMREEPAWRRPDTLLKLFARGGASNLPQVQSAFGYSTRVFEELPVLRNFYAHRNEETAKLSVNVARSLGVPSSSRPSEILSARLPGRPQNVLCDYLDDMRIVAELLCE